MDVADLGCFVTECALVDDFAVVFAVGFAVVWSHELSRRAADTKEKMIMKRHILGMSSNEKAER
jgi:hypothetical protein